MTEMAGVETDYTPSATYVEWLARDHPLICEYSEEPVCPKGQAEWIMHLVPCCSGMAQTLACTTCKDARLHSEDSVECGRCGLVTVPARHAYLRVEAL